MLCTTVGTVGVCIAFAMANVNRGDPMECPDVKRNIGLKDRPGKTCDNKGCIATVQRQLSYSNARSTNKLNVTVSYTF